MGFGVIIIIKMWDKAILQCGIWENCSNEANSFPKFSQMLEKTFQFDLTEIPQPCYVNIPTSTP